MIYNWHVEERSNPSHFDLMGYAIKAGKNENDPDPLNAG